MKTLPLGINKGILIWIITKVASTFLKTSSSSTKVPHLFECLAMLANGHLLHVSHDKPRHLSGWRPVVSAWTQQRVLPP